jgi:hypothetical protein
VLVNVCDVQLDNGGKVILKAAIDALADCPGFKDQSILDKVAATCANLPEGKIFSHKVISKATNSGNVM